MSTRSWAALALILAALAAANQAMGWELQVFLGRKLSDLIHWMAFWR